MYITFLGFSCYFNMQFENQSCTMRLFLLISAFQNSPQTVAIIYFSISLAVLVMCFISLILVRANVSCNFQMIIMFLFVGENNC